MKRTQAGTWRRFTAVLASVALVLGMNPSAAFATGAGAEGVSGGTGSAGSEIAYVSLGDSMTNGYGFVGYNQDSDDLSTYNFMKGTGMYGASAYPLQFEQYLKDKGYTVDHTKLAPSAMLAGDLWFLLGGRDEPADEWGGFRDYVGKIYKDDDAKLKAHFQESVANADIMTLCIGNAEFGAYLLNRITDALGVFGATLDDDEKVTLDDALSYSGLDDEQKALVQKAYDEMLSGLKSEIPSEYWKGYNVEQVCNLVAYTTAGFLVNYKGCLDAILSLNPDVEIIQIGLMNTTYGMNITMEDGSSIPVGDVMDGVFDLLNAYVAGIPAVKQATGEWSGATFYYADQPNPKFISQQFATLKANGWGDIQDGRLSGATVRNRNISAYNGSLRGVIGSAFLPAGAELPKIELSDVKAFEEGSPSWNSSSFSTPEDLKNLSVAIYLAIEEGVAESTETLDIPLSGLMKIAGDLGSVFKVSLDMGTPQEVRKSLATYLTSTDELKGMCKIYALFKVGNGMSVHPTPEGHDDIAKAVIAAYESGYTSADKTVDNLKAACEALGNLVAEYYDDACAYAYQYAVEQGYVDQALASIDEVIAALEAVDLESLEGTDAFKAELAAAIEKAVDALDAAKALIAAADSSGTGKARAAAVGGLDADSLDALMAALAEADEAVGQALDALEQAGADADALVVSVLEQVRAKLTSEVIPQIEADLGAAIDEAYAYISGKASEAVQRFAELVKETVADYAPEAADWIYNWLLENPDCVIAFVAEHGQAAADFIGQYADDAAQVLGWIYENYGEDIAGFLIDNRVEIFENMAKLVSEHGQNAWDLIEAYLDALDVRSSAESLYAQIIGSLNEDWEGVLAELEKTLSDLEIALNDAVDAILGELEDASAELEAEAAAKIQIELDRIQAEADRVMADIDAMIEAGAPSADEIEAALNELDGLVSDLEELAEQLPAEAEAAVKAAVSEIQGEIAALLDMLENKLVEAIFDATHGEYVVTEASSYVALGDAAAAGEGSYAGKLFAHMKGLASEAGFDLPDGRFANLAAEGLTSSAMLAALEAGEWDDELAGAGLVTVSVGYEELTSAPAAQAISVLQNYLGCVFAGVAYESADASDWSAYVGADAAACLDRAVDAVRAELADELGDESAAAMAGDIAEAYAFSYCGFAARCAEVLDAVRDRAPGAEVVLVGAGNPLEGLTLSFGGRDLEIGRYAGYVAGAANAQLLAYAVLGGDVTFVDASGAASDADAELAELAGMLAGVDFDAFRRGEASGQIDLLKGILDKADALGSAAAWAPNADGQEHVFGRILEAVEITAGAPEASQPSLARIAGDYANQTSALVSAEAFGDGECDAVVVARDDDFRDAMSAAGLAGALECPVLLTSRHGLSEAAAAEVERLGAKSAYVIGGPAALSESVDSALGGMGLEVERVWGEQSYDTSVECARLIAGLGGSDGGAAIVAYGQNFQDALSMSSFAYRYKVPIFLQTFGDTSAERGLTDEAAGLIGSSFPGTLYVAGGEGAVSSASLAAVGFDEKSGDVRLGGWDGYDTSAVIAGYMVGSGLLDAKTVAVCCGAVEANGLDALSGSALVGKRGGVLLLASGQPDYGAEHVSDMLGFLSEHRDGVSSAYVLGGAYVMPSAVYDAVADVWGLPHEAA